jgi:hypothetical protein
MAQLLYARNASRKHLNAARRHQRLCRQFPGTEALVDAIQLPYHALKNKLTATQKQEEQREDRYDDLLVADSLLDDQVRNVFRRCEEHDRANPAATVLSVVFPEGKFGPIVNMKIQQEPDAVANLALRLESLGKEHALFPLAKELRTRIAASRKAIVSYEASGQQVKQCRAEEEIAKATLRQQYETNYLDARKQFGKIRAERLFPKLKVSQRPLSAQPAE